MSAKVVDAIIRDASGTINGSRLNKRFTPSMDIGGPFLGGYDLESSIRVMSKEGQRKWSDACDDAVLMRFPAGYPASAEHICI